MRPVAESDGPDAPRLFHESFPSVTAMIDDVFVAFEDPVGEMVVAEELPDIFDGVELGRSGWQRQEGDVLRDEELCGHVPAGLVEDEHGVGISGHLGADLFKVGLHGGRIGIRHDERGTLAFRGTDRAENIGPLCAFATGLGPVAASWLTRGALEAGSLVAPTGG
jgi:hypothetical protein